MLETIETEQGRFAIKATVRRLGVYLDNFAIIRFARGDVDRRDRLVRAFARGADLMFSPVNAAEIIGPESPSSITAVRSFLESIGPHWFPLEGVDLARLLEREDAGASRTDVCHSTWFLEQFFAARSLPLHGEQRQGLVAPGYFDLGLVLDWLPPHRADIRHRVEVFHGSLASRLTQLRQLYERDRDAFDLLLPDPTWDPARPANFVWNGLIRRLVLEAKAFQLMPGDALDLCHAIAGVSFADFATLDRHWKRRVESLPRPNELAEVYYEPELDQLVEDIEVALA